MIVVRWYNMFVLLLQYNMLILIISIIIIIIIIIRLCPMVDIKR